MLNEFEKELMKEMLTEMEKIWDHADQQLDRNKWAWERINVIVKVLTGDRT